MIDIDIETQTCKNCGNAFTKGFCNSCGQKKVHRLTIPHVLHDMVHVFLHADKGIFPFMSRLVIYPGIMAREYIAGKRKIFNPFQYLILSVGFILFLMAQLHFYESLESYNTQSASKLPAYFQKAMADFNWFIKQYANVITFVTLPFYAFFSWLFFRKRKENYAEHFTVVVFLMCQINTINTIILIALFIFNITGLGMVTVSMFLVLASFFITYKQFYNLKWYTAVWKALLVYTLSYLAQVTVMGIGLLVYVLTIKANLK